MPTASAGVNGRGWAYYSSVKSAPRALPKHVDLSQRRPWSAASASSSPPPSWRPFTTAQPHAPQPQWKAWKHLLQQYSQREGHASVPLEHLEGGKRLGAWLSQQWGLCQAGRLSHDRMVQLEKAGVDWHGPPPPASGLVGPKYLNERKWDYGRGAHMAAMRGVAFEFDASPTPASMTHWAEYSAESDPHVKRRQSGSSAASSTSVAGSSRAWRSSRVSGLRWKSLGPTRPRTGHELVHEELAAALSLRDQFSPAQWEAFGIKEVRRDHFVYVDGTYFAPCDHGEKWGLLPDQRRVKGLPEELGRRLVQAREDIERQKLGRSSDDGR